MGVVAQWVCPRAYPYEEATYKLHERGKMRKKRTSPRHRHQLWSGVQAMLELRQHGADLQLRRRHPRRGAGKRLKTAFEIPGFCVPEYIRPLFCDGKGPFRWAAALLRNPRNICVGPFSRRFRRTSFAAGSRKRRRRCASRGFPRASAGSVTESGRRSGQSSTTWWHAAESSDRHRAGSSGLRLPWHLPTGSREHERWERCYCRLAVF